MAQRYFLQPYEFIPPYRGTTVCRLAEPLWRWELRNRQLVTSTEFRGLEFLKASVDSGAGVLLAPNHSRWADAIVMGALSVAFGKFFYYLVSSHLLRNSRAMGWVLNRLGCYSILREGVDIESLRTSSNILATAERPLVIFPEGTWFRQNDRLGPLQDGVALIARQAAKAADRPILVHPVAIKYWLLGDPQQSFHKRLSRLERRFLLKQRTDRDWVSRIERVMSAYLATVEIDWTGQPRSGDQDERIRILTDNYIAALEKDFADGPRKGYLLERIRWLRQRLVKQCNDPEVTPEEKSRRLHQLDYLLACENLGSHSAAYLRESPTQERIGEAIARIDETMFDAAEKPVGRTESVIEVGPAIDVRAYPKIRGGDRTAGDPLMAAIGKGIQGMLDRLANSR